LEIAEILRTRRVAFGISSVVVFERDLEAFTPAVACLSGG
jgi:hypothetical protein